MSMLLTFNVPSPVIFVPFQYKDIQTYAKWKGEKVNTKIGERDSNVERWQQER